MVKSSFFHRVFITYVTIRLRLLAAFPPPIFSKSFIILVPQGKGTHCRCSVCRNLASACFTHLVLFDIGVKIFSESRHGTNKPSYYVSQVDIFPIDICIDKNISLVTLWNRQAGGGLSFILSSYNRVLTEVKSWSDESTIISRVF